MEKIFIIAEAGVNHNGSVKAAKKMIDVAREAGADAVKFQTFKAEEVISRHAPKAEYQRERTDKNESFLDMVKKLELDAKTHEELFNYCRKKRILFMSSPFDLHSIDLLNNLGVKIFKIPSGEITNLPFLKKIGSLKKKIILSTGMSDLAEIKKALGILVKAGTPKQDITVLHCNTEYPTPIKDVNLLAMLTIKNRLKVNVGYSDHTLGIEFPIAAAALGARVIEKHFTLNKNMDGPDHKASLEPDELQSMIRAIRKVEKGLGNGIKQVTPSESKNKMVARKSIVAKRDISAGEKFCEENITVKRPAKGISPMEWNKVLGVKAKRNFKKDEFIEI